jgi:hypothetical protein
MGLTVHRAPANHSCVKEGTQDLRRNSPPTQGGIFLLWRLSPFLPCELRAVIKPNIPWNSVSGRTRAVAVSRAVGGGGLIVGA